MIMDVLSLLLPVLWALVACLIGLVLYKTSEAIFEKKKSSPTEKRRVRLVGSVVIAALAFCGMWYATPADRLAPLQTGMVSVPQERVAALQSAEARLNRAIMEVQGCVAALSPSDCKVEISDARDRAIDLHAELATLTGADSSHPTIH